MRNALELAYSRYADYAANWRPEQFADYTSATGTWVVGSANTWVAGFTPGVMWELDEAAGRDGEFTRAWETRAGQWARRVMTSNLFSEDVGFRMLSALEPWTAQLEAAGDSSGARAVAVRMEDEARSKLTSRWNETVGAFQTTWRPSNNPEADYGVLIDQTYDLALLQWAAARVAADYPEEASLIRTRVLRHAQQAAAHLVRADGSSYQWGYFSSESGQFVQGETFQGHSNSSTWSRGHAWGMLGFSEIARRAAVSGGAADPQLLALARGTAARMADWFLARLPADLVPYWDFNDPAIPNAPRDSSAAGIAANALLTLAALPGLSSADATRYFTAAESVLGSLAGSYLSTGRNEDSVLIHGSGNVPAAGAVDRGLIYGDYFFLRAANQWFATTGSAQSALAPGEPATKISWGDGSRISKIELRFRPVRISASMFSQKLIDDPQETHAEDVLKRQRAERHAKS